VRGEAADVAARGGIRDHADGDGRGHWLVSISHGVRFFDAGA
jgi:hypothetical protein